MSKFLGYDSDMTIKQKEVAYIPDIFSVGDVSDPLKQIVFKIFSSMFAIKFHWQSTPHCAIVLETKGKNQWKSP